MTQRSQATGTGQRRTSLLLLPFPSLTDVAFLLPLVFIFVKLQGAQTLLGDGDTGWHIRTGEWILANKAVPRHDLFSYTRPEQPWFAWEWLWDAVFAGLHAAQGLPAVVSASLLVICLTCALLYRETRRQSGDAIVSIVVTILAASAMSIHWLARPHLFTLLFGVVLFGLAERTRADGNWLRLAWSLPLMAVWANVHGGFIAGLLTIACYLAGELLSAATAVAPEERRLARADARRWGLAFVGCAAATLATPYGWTLHQHIFGYLNEPYHFLYISEFRSLSFQSPAAIYFEILLALGFGAALFSLYERRYAHALLLLGWAHLALISARNIPIFAVFAAPLAANAVVAALRSLRTARLAGWIPSSATALSNFSADISRTDAAPRIHLASGAAFLLICLLMAAPNAPGAFKAQYDDKTYPEIAIRTLDELGADRTFTTDEWGDYLIYRRHPQLQVFIDGRSDFYGAEFGERYLSTMSVHPGWQNALDEYGVDTVLLPVKASLSGALKENPRWPVVYDDGVAVIFRRRGPLGPDGEERALDVVKTTKHGSRRLAQGSRHRANKQGFD